MQPHDVANMDVNDCWWIVGLISMCSTTEVRRLLIQLLVAKGRSRNLPRMKMEEDRGAESWLEGPQDG
jgi:hypothetical protein